MRTSQYVTKDYDQVADVLSLSKQKINWATVLSYSLAFAGLTNLVISFML
jgi:hypothetical protein